MSGVPKDEGRFESACVVGLGKHALTKILPALQANGQSIVGVVTSQADVTLSAPVFRDLRDALSALPQATLFVIATPPHLHFSQAMQIIAAGRDVLVEKPAFLSVEQVTRVLRSSERMHTIWIEGFMHRHRALYGEMIQYWNQKRDVIEAIDATFLIPEMPLLTFRRNTGLASSSLYDMGCYALSLFVDLGLTVDDLHIERLDVSGADREEKLLIGGRSGRHSCRMTIGVDPVYSNVVLFRETGSKVVSFAPFFFGRPGDATITQADDGPTLRWQVAQKNAFEAMLAVKKLVWRESQSRRGQDLLRVTAALERLGVELEAARRVKEMN